MSRYVPKKKRVERVVVPMKLIRIDFRTEIEVPQSMPNDEAIERYYKKHKDIPRERNIPALPKAKDNDEEEITEDDLAGFEPLPDDEDEEE